MIDVGEAKFALGFQLTRDRSQRKIWLSQETFIDGILRRFNMDQCNPVATPLSPSEPLTKQQVANTEKKIERMRNVPYQEAVGCLLFAARVSRPDILFAVSSVSRFNNNPGTAHWTTVKRIFRYMKGTKN